MTDPRTDEDRIRGIVQAANMDPIPIANEYDIGWVDKDDAQPLASGESDTKLFSPTADNVWLIRGLQAIAPTDSDATGGTHKIQIYFKSAAGLINLKSDNTSKVGFSYGGIVGNQTKSPKTDIAAQNILYRSVITSEFPLTIYYENNLDVSQEEERSYRLRFQRVRKTI